MKVLFAASEVVPFAKTGGLADVAGALPQALADAGVQIDVVMPRYKTVEPARKLARVAGDVVTCSAGRNVRVFFIEQEKYFGRDGLYQDKKGDYPDNLERFSYFCRRTLTMIRECGLSPDIIHLNDWQTSLIPAYLRSGREEDPSLAGIRTVLTIHNLGYQGIFPAALFPKLCLDGEYYSVEGFEFFGRVNLLKGGIVFADAITTVSPTYARQIQTSEYGFGLDGVLRERAGKISGILNGLDYGVWNPETDGSIPRTYSMRSPAGKVDNKRLLQERCGFPVNADAPLIGVVSRLASQKGIDILLEALERVMAMGCQLIVLGDGDEKYVAALQRTGKRYKGRLSVNVRFDDPLAHLIYAGADIFLMPSRYEPCGLGQMISLKYGTIPVVYKTGGLADTVSAENGFLFQDYSGDGLAEAVADAVKTYRSPEKWKRLAENAMRCDFSWKKAAQDYRSIYERIVAAP